MYSERLLPNLNTAVNSIAFFGIKLKVLAFLGREARH